MRCVAPSDVDPSRDRVLGWHHPRATSKASKGGPVAIGAVPVGQAARGLATGLVDVELVDFGGMALPGSPELCKSVGCAPKAV
jgi:hypothetical protein